MTFGTRRFNNGKERGYLHFGTGKNICLNGKELEEFKQKLRWAEYTGREKERRNK